MIDCPDDEIALICGSRSLTERGPAAERWGRHLITCIADHAEVFLSGDAGGPDSWARDEVVRVSSERLRGRFYLLNGLVTDAWGTPLGRWVSADRVPPPGHPQRRRWPLVRDLAMVRALALRARRDGRRVSCYGLVDPASATHGTAYTLGRARDAGIATHAERWDPGAWVEFERSISRSLATTPAFEGDTAR